MEETVSIQWKNYEIDSPEYVEVLEETRKIVDDLREEWNKTLIHPFVFFNEHGNMFECLKKEETGHTCGHWINHLITLIQNENERAVGFNFSDPEHILAEAIAGEPVDKTLSNGHRIKRQSSYENGWITCVYDDKKLIRKETNI
tara:strand:- start:7214 stop:7645 length:432 start_codon:yes stop_codon:yes gene_type:complete